MANIKSSDLSYNNSLPPFLQRLRALNSSQNSLHSTPQPRPKRQRAPEDEEEDEPTYVDANGDVLTHSEFHELKEKRDNEGDVEMSDSPSPTHARDAEEEEARRRAFNEREIERGTMGREKEKLAAIGAGRRRKAGRVVGADLPSPREPKGNPMELLFMRDVETEMVTEQVVEVMKAPKPKKKVKTKMLSFGDEEEL